MSPPCRSRRGPSRERFTWAKLLKACCEYLTRALTSCRIHTAVDQYVQYRYGFCEIATFPKVLRWSFDSKGNRCELVTEQAAENSMARNIHSSCNLFGFPTSCPIASAPTLLYLIFVRWLSTISSHASVHGGYQVVYDSNLALATCPCAFPGSGRCNQASEILRDRESYR
jgi:hypothetical protein